MASDPPVRARADNAFRRSAKTLSSFAPVVATAAAITKAAGHRRAATGADPASRNNFNLLRLLAALAVFVSHAFPLAGRDQPMVGSVATGTVGVYVFFVISGYLVFRSWSFDPRVGAFLVKRCLRIFPGLLAALLFAALVVGPLVTSRTLSAYFTDPLVPRFVGGALLLFPAQLALPGVFQHNPVPGAVNGSLWTLGYEFLFYVMIVYFGRMLNWRSAKPVTLGLLVSLLVFGAFGGSSAHLYTSWLFVDAGVLIRFATLFAGGMVLFAFRDRVPLRGDVSLVLGAVWAISWSTPVSAIATAVILPYLVIYLALGRPPSLQALIARGDISYGVYIYAFPMEQLAARFLGARVNPAGVMVIALAPTLLLASLSWHLIERRCLGLKRLLTSRSGLTLSEDKPSRPAGRVLSHD